MSTKAAKANKDQVEEVVEEKTVGVSAKVTEVLSRTGNGGGVIQVRVKFHDPKTHADRNILRNVKGNIRVGDTITLMETEREARRVA